MNPSRPVSLRTERVVARTGERIRALRGVAGLTQEALSERVGIGQRHIQKIERGITSPSLALLVLIADEFDCTLDDLCPVEIDGKEPCHALG